VFEFTEKFLGGGINDNSRRNTKKNRPLMKEPCLSI
jgi:hypothetical protein